ncbi:phosphoenolpyruvate carboxylase [Mycobacterium sp. 852014-50255_SCH5639931]|uniref:phosphoenolpyruvate carboxylase n=1 Tax=Mycobacterium sp. 852014-50255_SCH5639931 TaxID=1834112 RepID=UPI001E582813|nr:phosphoenolpyruvate carboxylase [Mycobacterium sp. 852014-50255_SCH5639931]
MTTHPTSMNAGEQIASGGYAEPTIYRICVRGRIRVQRVAMTVDNLAALITAEPIATNWRNQMKPREFRRSPAEYGSGAARTPWLLHRMRDAAAIARRWAHRKGDAAMDTVPAIDDQLHALRPICSAQGVSSGTACGAPAVAVAEIHAIDECDQMGLTPDGDLVETLCQTCLEIVQWAMATYVGDTREMASRCGTHPVCTTCGRPTGYLRSVFAARPIGLAGLTS